VEGNVPFTRLQNKGVRGHAVGVQEMLEGRALLPIVMLGVVRYAQDVLDDGQEQNGAADRIESPTKPRSLRRIAAETKDAGVNNVGSESRLRYGS